MSDSAERALSALVDRFADDLKRELLKGLGGGAAGPGTGLLCAGFKRIHAARNQTDILQALLEAADNFSGRSAVLVMKGDRLTGWRGRGLDEANLRQVNMPPDGNAGWKQAPASPDPLPKSLAQAFFESVGAPADRTAYLLPLLVKERPVAMLYADSGQGEPLDREALEALARTAGICLELTAIRPRGEAAAAVAGAVVEAPLESRPEAAPLEMAAAPEPVAEPLPPPPAPVPQAAPPPPPAPKRITGPDFESIPPADHDVHKKAFRFAKLLVDELLLYNKEKVAQGKRNRDVYGALQEDIDKSRQAYEKKFGKTPAAAVDYFHQQMVQVIGDGDPSILGSGYPGPAA